MCLGFQRKPQDKMDDHGDSCRAKLPDCFFKTGKRVAAADPCSRFRMDRLQPKFYPDGFFGIQFTKKLNFFRL